MPLQKPTAIDFFSGSGLVTEGLRKYFNVAWANDNDAQKNAVYRANFPRAKLEESAIEGVSAKSIPKADLAWASFPCQDLSLAGNMNGISHLTRSGLFWQWIRILDEMALDQKPPVLAIENVVGFLLSNGGADFRSAYTALRDRGYRAGVLVSDAINFLPHSRPRAFVIAVNDRIDFEPMSLKSAGASGFHGAAVIKAYSAVNDSDWIWWNLPRPPARKVTLANVIEDDVAVDPKDHTSYLLSMLSARNEEKLRKARTFGLPQLGTGYRRVRKEGKRKLQRLELRFDGIAGCLRTPNGGSSRQILVIVRDKRVSTRLLTVRETARLMGVRDSYKLPGTYNAAYKAMGDAVAVPVTQWLAKHLLHPLALQARNSVLLPSRTRETVNA